MTNTAYCQYCVHYRLRAQAELFSAADMQSAGGLKASLEWEQERIQLRFTEQQKVDAEENKVLDYEPQFHAWCAAASPFDEEVLRAVDEATAASEEERTKLASNARQVAEDSRKQAAELLTRARAGDYEAVTRLVEQERIRVDPVGGDIQETYVLCQRVNPSGRCPLFDRKER